MMPLAAGLQRLLLQRQRPSRRQHRSRQQLCRLQQARWHRWRRSTNGQSRLSWQTVSDPEAWPLCPVCLTGWHCSRLQAVHAVGFGHLSSCMDGMDINLHDQAVWQTRHSRYILRPSMSLCRLAPPGSCQGAGAAADCSAQPEWAGREAA